MLMTLSSEKREKLLAWIEKAEHTRPVIVVRRNAAKQLGCIIRQDMLSVCFAGFLSGGTPYA